jgi:hypothetical protein
MKGVNRAVIAVLIYIALSGNSLYAACKAEACRRAIAWKAGFTAVVLDDAVERDDYRAAFERIRAEGGIIAIEADNVLLGWVPQAAAAKIRSMRGVRVVSYAPVAALAKSVEHESSRSALSFFNQVLTGAYEDVIEAGLATAATVRPLTGCIIPRPTSSSSKLATSSFTEDSNSKGFASLGSFQPAPNFFYQTPYQNPDMRGRVTVQLFSMESDGGAEPDYYTWPNADYQFARNQVYGAFTFWVNEAAARGITLSFRVAICDPFSHYTRNYIPMRTHYEPVLHPSTEDYLWMNDALSYLGYGASPITRENVYSQNEAFDRSKLYDPVYGTFDRSFSVYLIYNPFPAAPSQLPDGYRAYALADGPQAVVLWNAGGLGPNNIGMVLTHETGHIFWACDEYYEAPTNTGCFSCALCYFNVGPRNQIATPNITNANCENPNATSCDVPLVGCMMKQYTYSLCPHTPGQIGW